MIESVRSYFYIDERMVHDLSEQSRGSLYLAVESETQETTSKSASTGLRLGVVELSGQYGTERGRRVRSIYQHSAEAAIPTIETHLMRSSPVEIVSFHEIESRRSNQQWVSEAGKALLKIAIDRYRPPRSSDLLSLVDGFVDSAAAFHHQATRLDVRRWRGKWVWLAAWFRVVAIEADQVILLAESDAHDVGVTLHCQTRMLRAAAQPYLRLGARLNLICLGSVLSSDEPSRDVAMSPVYLYS